MKKWLALALALILCLALALPAPHSTETGIIPSRTCVMRK